MVRTAILPTAIVLVCLAVCGTAVRAQAPDDSAAGAVYGRAGTAGLRMAMQRNNGMAPEEPTPTEAMPSETPPGGGVPESGPPQAEPLPPGIPMQGASSSGAREMFPLATQMFDNWEQTWAPIVSSSVWFGPSRWYSVTDVQTLNHEKALRNFHLALDASTNQFFDDRSMGLGLSAGLRETIGFWICRDTNGWDHSIEATYRGPDNWHQAFDFIGAVPGAVFNPLNFASAGSNGADAAFFYYKSLFDSGELNLRWTKRFGKDELLYDPEGFWKQEAEDGHTFSFLVGVRATELDEKYDSFFVQNGVPFTTFGSHEHVRTQNSLVGVNFGAELDFHRNLWFVGARIKGSPCLNFAEMNRSLAFNDTAAGASGDVTENQGLDGPAFITEFSLLAGWQITPRISLRASYDFMWMTSIALAPDQASFQPIDRKAINVTNGQLLDGASLGLMFHW